LSETIVCSLYSNYLRHFITVCKPVQQQSSNFRNGHNLIKSITNRKRSRFRLTQFFSLLVAGLYKMLYFCYKFTILMPDDSLE